MFSRYYKKDESSRYYEEFVRENEYLLSRYCDVDISSRHYSRYYPGYTKNMKCILLYHLFY